MNDYRVDHYLSLLRTDPAEAAKYRAEFADRSAQAALRAIKNITGRS
jgi:hypothetical protein